MGATKKTKEDALHRLRTVSGHIQKIISMVEDGEYCMDVLNQSTAVRNALTKVEALLLDDHLHTCVIADVKKGKKKAVDELTTLFKKINK